MPRKGSHPPGDYIEAVYMMTVEEDRETVETKQLASRLKISPSTVTEAFQKLTSEGYLEYKPYYGVTLTPKGYEFAVETATKHRLLERFFVDFLDLDADLFQREICEIEHHLSGEPVERLCHLMDFPDKCPHGKPIPCRRVCKESGQCIIQKIGIDHRFL